MPKLTAISPRRFEIVRDRIGAILADEIPSQYTLNNLPFDAPNKVWVARFNAFDQSELPAININLSTGDYSNKDARAVDGTYIYYIDCHTLHPDSESGPGDIKATMNLHRLMGIILAIFENPVYRTLDFSPPFSCQVAVTGVRVMDPKDDPEANYNTFGRVLLQVKVPEHNNLKDAPLITGGVANVKLHETNKGFYYQFLR